jgi:methyl coenzyme M reductase alpha subunit
MLCHRGWTVGELDPKAQQIRTLAEGPPQPGFNGVSAAAIARHTLWLGSYQSSRLARVTGWVDTDRKQDRQ